GLDCPAGGRRGLAHEVAAVPRPQRRDLHTGRLVADSAAPCDDQECGDHERVPDAPPPRRYVRPPPPYGPPPGVLYDPWARRAVPCILTVLTLGALPVCI